MVVRDLAHHLDQEKFDISICCTKGIDGEIAGQLITEGYDVFSLPKRADKKVDYLSSLKLRRILKERDIQMVHTHATPALFDAALCRATIPSLKLVHTFHYGNYPFNSFRYHLLELLSTRTVDQLIAVGIEQSKVIQKTYNIAKDKIQTIWNGVNMLELSPNATFRKEIAAQDSLLVGTIAKLIPQKGLFDLLAVAKKCKEKGVNAKFVIVGEGPLRKELENQRSELRLEDDVIITGWIKDAAATVLPEFDIFFQPSHWEAMSIAILEAMAKQKAIIATRVGDNPHVLQDNDNGVLINTGDISSMVEAIIRLSDKDLRSKLGDSARLRYQENFTISHMVKAYEDIYFKTIRK